MRECTRLATHRFGRHEDPWRMYLRGAVAEVAILLGLYNGGRWLGEQLESFAAQQRVSWRLIVSDDGSTDDGPEIAQAFGCQHDVAFHQGPRNGPAQNFLLLLRLAGSGTPFAALSDQDDVWLPEKLSRALNQLKKLPPDRPALYAGRTIICDEDLRRTGLSPLFRRTPSFRNALVQSIGGGNTMVLNRAALTLAQEASLEAREIVMHDWWLYQIVSGAGGSVIHDTEPMLLYRQHPSNQMGSNRALAARLRRAGMVAAGDLRRWNEVSIAALKASAHRLTPENQVVLDAFARAREQPFLQRLHTLRRLGLYRQTRRGSVSYWCAAAAGLI